ncbi:Uma2 family endonuclease [Kovacikia minuta CCNUW1]|uniref:Uma2 family endonuclease n=1 Tax=Kovacikia minuta TaxID=2931930 RepID=UPI001CCFFDEA|nr:Uma2 family endonuclease [Kovacikia minuta]UBF27569.1 Uma2 family endonuclease [Kovacikia minuta CCNUW1]
MSITAPSYSTEELAERGWRVETIVQPDGTAIDTRVPLTPEEFLHPKESYHLPNSTFHDDVAGAAKDMLTRRYADEPTTAVYRDLIFRWGIPGLGDHCPDTCVVFGVRNKEQVRTEFVVLEEGVRPSLVIEVVSPYYRKQDREIKVKEYAQAGVQEYVIFDRRKQRGQMIEEVLGYRLVEGQYLPITPDEEGRILSETVGLLIGLQDSQVVMLDSQTGERLLTSLELEQRASQAEARASQAEARASQAEERAARLAEMLRSQGIDPDQIG